MSRLHNKTNQELMALYLSLMNSFDGENDLEEVLSVMDQRNIEPGDIKITMSFTVNGVEENVDVMEF